MALLSATSTPDCVKAQSGTDGAVPRSGLSAKVDTLTSMLPALLEAAFKESGLPSLSVALVHGETVVYSQAFGYADLENRLPATRATVYPIGSITKVFTATMLVRMAEEGILTLDTPVKTYLPEYKVRSPFDGTQPATLRQLATHTSGLPREANVNFWSDFATLQWVLSAGKTEMRWYAPVDEVLASLASMTLVYPPNSQYLYSNLGMTLLGIALERAAGISFEDYVKDEILAPLGMDDTGFRSDVAKRGPLPIGYVPLEEGADPIVAPEWELEAAQFSGGLYSTAEDMARFISLQFRDEVPGGSQILSGDGLRMMHLESLAWGYVYDPRYKGVESTGGHLGFHAIVRAYPSLKIGIVALTNSNNPLRDGHPADKIARAILGELKKVVEGAAPSEATSSELPDYAGRYVLAGANAEISVTPEGRGLRVRLPSDSSFVMVSKVNDEFGLEGDPDTWLYFIRGESGGVHCVSFAGFRFDKVDQ